MATSATSTQKAAAPTPRIKPSSVVYWMRFGLGILAGLTNDLLQINSSTFGDFAPVLGIGLGIVFYVVSVMLVRHVFHYGETELKGKSRDVTLGGGTFIFVWIMITVLVYTLKP